MNHFILFHDCAHTLVDHSALRLSSDAAARPPRNHVPVAALPVALTVGNAGIARVEHTISSNGIGASDWRFTLCANASHSLRCPLS